MNSNFKALRRTLVATAVLSALLAPTLMADDEKHTGGHFTNDAAKGDASLEVIETKSFPHTTRFHLEGMKGIKCTDATYTGEMSEETETEVILSPEFKQCWQGTHGSKGEENVTFTMNGCTYVLTIRETKIDEKHSALHFDCPEGKKIEIQIHETCLITIPTQTQTDALTYHTYKEKEKHELTVRVTVPKLKYEKHGLCALFVPPTGTGPHETGIELTGRFVIKAFDGEANQVNFTATGIDGQGEEEEAKEE